MDNTSGLFGFLSQLLAEKQLMPFMITVTIILLAVIGIAIFAIRGIFKVLVKKKFHANINGHEFSYDGTEPIKPNGTSDGQSNAKKANIEKFSSTIVSIVNYSIENGYENCRIRQQLFDTQMSNITQQVELILTTILNEYFSRGGQNHEVAKVLVKHALDKQVYEPLKKICAADRLAEKTKERIVELNRPMIEATFNHIKFELTRLAQSVQHTADDENGVRFSYQDDRLMQALESQKDAIKRSMIDCLEKAYDEASKFLEEVHNNNKSLNTKVSNSIKQYLESTEEHDKLPKDWLIETNITPPNRVIGGE